MQKHIGSSRDTRALLDRNSLGRRGLIAARFNLNKSDGVAALGHDIQFTHACAAPAGHAPGQDAPAR